MRIATNLLYNQANSQMGALNERAGALQTQIATNKRIATPSGDAIAYRQLTGIRRAASDQVADSANITLAAAQLAASDTALGAVETQLQRAHEIAVQASSGTLSATQRAAFGTELDAIVQDLVRLANATDSRGQPLFSGSSDALPYTQAQNGTVSYGGVGEAGAIPIGDDATIQATTSGARAFAVTTPNGASDVFKVVQDLAAALRTDGDSKPSIDTLQSALAGIADTRASIGARGARLDLETSRLADTAVTREETRSKIEDTDISATITELQKTLTILQATQASFTKLTSLSLFDYLR